MSFARPKSSSFDVAIRGDQDVRGLQVAMKDAPLVGGVQRTGDLEGQPHRFVRRERPPQRRALDVLQHEIAGPTS